MEKPSSSIAPHGVVREALPPWLEGALTARAQMAQMAQTARACGPVAGASGSASSSIRSLAGILDAMAGGRAAAAVCRPAGDKQNGDEQNDENGGGQAATGRRWAPSGGDLGSAELYLIADDPGGTPGRVYRYHHHALIPGRGEPAALGAWSRYTDLPPGGAAMAVLVAAHGRLSLKYGRFAYRLAHLDAGCAAMQLSVIVHDLGLTLRFASYWEEQLSRLLGLDNRIETITAVAAIGRTDGPRCR